MMYNALQECQSALVYLNGILVFSRLLRGYIKAVQRELALLHNLEVKFKLNTEDVRLFHGHHQLLWTQEQT